MRPESFVIYGKIPEQGNIEEILKNEEMEQNLAGGRVTSHKWQKHVKICTTHRSLGQGMEDQARGRQTPKPGTQEAEEDDSWETREK